MKNLIDSLFSLIMRLIKWSLGLLWAMLKSPTFWKLVVLVVMFGSVYSAYYFARLTYNFHCGAGGYFVSKQDCETFANAKFLEIENDRLERVNDDLKDQNTNLSLNQ